jgi:hypothetical protein
MRAEPDFRPFFPRPAAPQPPREQDVAALTLALFPTLFAVIGGTALGLVLVIEPHVRSGAALFASGFLGSLLGWPGAWLVASRLQR